MTISNTNRKAGPFTGNGVTVAFPFTFKVFTQADVLVVLALVATGTETVQALTTNYTVALNADQNANPGGTITMLVAPSVGYTLTATSQVAELQPIDVTNGGGFYPSILNAAFDRATIQIQQLSEKVGRALKTALSTPAGVSSDLPAPAAYKVLAWNGTATGLENTDPALSSALAADLAAPAGAALMGATRPGTGTPTTVQTLFSEMAVSNIANLLAAAPMRTVQVLRYHFGVEGGGGNFFWDSTKDRALHNGGTVIDPTRTFPADWTNQAQVTAWFTPSAGTGCWVRQFDGALNIRWFGAKGDSTADDTKATQKAIDQAVTLALAVYVSPGVYRTTAPLTIPQNAAVGNAYGVSIYGDNASWQAVSVFYAQHTGSAILSLKGANGCLIEGIKLVSHATTFPKCALILGRDVNVDSCGWHTINRIWIDGLYSKAAIYSIASEENRWSDIFVQLRGGGALYGFYTSTGDVLAVDSLPSSSNIANSITKMNIWSWVNDVNAACVYIEGAQAVGSWSFTDCYCIPKSGSYYQINIGAIDGLACLGPFTFIGCGGEIYDPISPWLDSPLNGFKISSPGGAIDVIGLTILNSRCQLINAASTRKILNVASNLRLVKPNIVIQPLEDVTTTYTAIRNKIKAGIFDVANSSSWIPLTFSGVWANNFGAPYAQASFQVDSTGTLSLRGTVNNGTTGANQIAQLPGGYEPSSAMFFTVSDGAAIAKILVSVTGAISLSTGTGAAVDLSNVRFKLLDA